MEGFEAGFEFTLTRAFLIKFAAWLREILSSLASATSSLELCVWTKLTKIFLLCDIIKPKTRPALDKT